MKFKFFEKCVYTFLLLISPHVLLAQQKTITGKIQDSETQQPLPGVTISLKGTAKTVVSDNNGDFSIVVPSNESTLVISYVGYRNLELKVGSQSSLNLSLTKTESQLTDVVVVGYGTQRKRDVTGAMTSLKPSDFNKGVVLTPQQLLQGRAAGVNVTANSGRPGGAAAISIRGGTSFSSNNEVLYVVAGVLML